MRGKKDLSAFVDGKENDFVSKMISKIHFSTLSNRKVTTRL